MKKKKIILVIAVVLILLLIPYRKDMLWDGGSVEYKSVLCKYTKVHKLADSGGYNEGLIIEFLGLKIFDNTKIVDEWKSKDYYEPISLNIKSNTLTNKGATFMLKNNTDEEYSYGEPYIIEKFENDSWKELDTLTGNPLSWNEMLYILKSNEESEININWSFGYGELKSGTYRLVKNNFRKNNSPESRAYTVYAEFDVK
jgi:hypothetical protein